MNFPADGLQNPYRPNQAGPGTATPMLMAMMITGRTACEDTIRRSDLSDCPNWRVRRISFPIRVAYRWEGMQVLCSVPCWLRVAGCGGRASLWAGAGLAGRIVLRRLLPLDCVGQPAPGAVVNTVNGPHRGRVHQLTPHLTQSKPRISHGLRRTPNCQRERATGIVGQPGRAAGSEEAPTE